jgi:hypothetical protein
VNVQRQQVLKLEVALSHIGLINERFLVLVLLLPGRFCTGPNRNGKSAKKSTRRAISTRRPKRRTTPVHGHRCFFSHRESPRVVLRSSALLSTSGVFIALLISRTTFNISSFMVMIMMIDIVAKRILLLDADQKMRRLRLHPPNAAAGIQHRRRIVSAATAPDRRYRWRADLDGVVSDHQPGGAAAVCE